MKSGLIWRSHVKPRLRTHCREAPVLGLDVRDAIKVAALGTEPVSSGSRVCRVRFSLGAQLKLDGLLPVFVFVLLLFLKDS